MTMMDYQLLYESMLTQKQQLDEQHQLLGDEVKRLKSVISKLKENATAQSLALKAAKAMQQAETERADKAESELQRIHKLAQCGTVQNFLALSDDEKGNAFVVMMRTDKAQIDMINELESRADANERDAERYRWLLKQAWFQDACYRYDLEDGGRQNKFEELLGITIDQAMRHL